jgi:hypothetical protein
LTADLLLTNCRVLTLNPQQLLANAVAVRGETILAVGDATVLRSLCGPKTQLINCKGQTLMPGFVDAHLHLLALAGSLTGVDCSEATVRSIDDLKVVISRQAAQTPPGEWIRGYGYDDQSLREVRHPTRWDLDSATSQHPVRLNHRSGHATALNSRGLALVGIGQNTPDPIDGVIQRKPNSGEPTGLILEMAGFLRESLGSEPDRQDEGISRMNQKLLECGITSVQDAGQNNDLARWSLFRELVDSKRLLSRVTMMAGASHLEEFTDAGITWGCGYHQLRIGHAKIMLTMTTGDLYPDPLVLRALVSECHQAGFPVAIHAVEGEAVTAAARILGDDRFLRHSGDDSALCDRIEHCSECTTNVLGLVRESGAMVVTQPGFIYWNGDRYLSRVEPGILAHLYPVDFWHSAGVSVAFSSDAPVIDPNPWYGIYAAVTRCTKSQTHFSQHPANSRNSGISVLEALRMYTIGGAYAEGTEQFKGSIQAGKLADLILIDADPTLVNEGELKDIKTVLTMIGGKVVWERGSPSNY